MPAPAPRRWPLSGSKERYGLVLGGSARAEPAGTFATDALVVRLSRLAGEVDRARRPSERAADVLIRLGKDRLASLLLEDAGR